ncbi:MAG: type 4a pilus biogenesis protein PilO [Phycisphaera sp.]|nr:type 4a pilus biogenesis protein PilO [Phycisphaera sp.]
MRIEKDQFKTLGVLVAMGCVFVFALWMPHHKRMEALRDRVVTAQRQMGVDRQSTAALVGLAQEVLDLKQQLGESSRFVPEGDDLADLLKQLSNDLESHNVFDREMQTRSAVNYANFSLIPVTLRFRGSFPAVYDFLDKIESMRRVVRVDRVQAEGRPGKGDGLVDAQIELSAFFSSVEGG